MRIMVQPKIVILLSETMSTFYTQPRSCVYISWIIFQPTFYILPIRKPSLIISIFCTTMQSIVLWWNGFFSMSSTDYIIINGPLLRRCWRQINRSRRVFGCQLRPQWEAYQIFTPFLMGHLQQCREGYTIFKASTIWI